MGNYLTEQEKFLGGKLSCRAKDSIRFIQISWCEIILQSKERIAFMLLISLLWPLSWVQREENSILHHKREPLEKCGELF
jgi:hypothetical protein